MAREAARQSRRAWLPSVEPVTTFADLAGRPDACRAEPGGDPLSLHHPLVLVGPEGGWDPDELAADLPPVALGDGVLRAETAPLAVLAALTLG